MQNLLVINQECQSTYHTKPMGSCNIKDTHVTKKTKESVEKVGGQEELTELHQYKGKVQRKIYSII